MDNIAQMGFYGGYRLRWVPPTPICYWYNLRTTLESYAVRENDESSSDFGPFWWFLEFMLRETMLSWACEGVIDWNRVLPTLSIFALPMRYSCISVITQNESPCKVLRDLGFFLTSETFVFRILFHFFSSLNFSFFSDLIFILGIVFFFERIFFPDNRGVKKKQGWKEVQV